MLTLSGSPRLLLRSAAGSSTHPHDEPDPPPPPPQSGDDAVRDYTFLAYRVTRRHHADPEEAFQDALLALWQAGESWSRIGEFRSYAVQRMKWRLVDGYRRRHGRGHAAGDYDTLDGPYTTPRQPTHSGEMLLPPHILTALGVVSHHDVTDFAADTLADLLSVCTPRERDFIALRIEGHDDEYIAASWGVHFTRVSQIRHAIRVKYAAFVASH